MTKKHTFIEYKYTRPEAGEMQKRATEFFRLMNKRRSIRDFSSDPIPDGVLEDIIRTASTAPSGANMQPWFFGVITDPALKKQIRKAVEEEELKNYKERFPQEWLDDLEPLGTDHQKPHIEVAPAIIVVFKEPYRVVTGKKEKNYYVNESVGIASGILISAIHNAGLVTLTHTPNPMRFLNTMLNRPPQEIPVLLMPVGFPKYGAQVPDITRKSLDQVMKKY